MTNKTMKGINGRRRIPHIWEYRLYFSLIFLIGLVPATVHCFLARIGVSERTKGWNGILNCAWDKARAYTPMIFSA